jgi:hypothetical protein
VVLISENRWLQFLRLTLSLGSELREKEREKKSKSSDNGVCIKAIKKNKRSDRKREACGAKQARQNGRKSFSAMPSVEY